MNILIVEDELKVAEFMKKGLEVQGYTIGVAKDGNLGLKEYASGKYQLIILDINIPFVNGIDFCRQVRKQDGALPILMLTALGTTTDKVKGFDAGADDYLVKPFEFDELLVRVKALLRRLEVSTKKTDVLRFADLEMDIGGKKVYRSGKRILLTAKEFKLLEYLLRNQGTVLSRMDISREIWDINFDTGTNIIDLYIYYLRKKIDKDFSPKLIHTQFGMGYVLKDEE